MIRILYRTIKSAFRALGFEIARRNVMEEDGFAWLQKQNIKTVLDIGSNAGGFSQMIRHLLPEARIYSFEPLKDCYEQLQANMKNAPNFTAFNFALGNETGSMRIRRSEFSPSSSLLEMTELHKHAFPFTTGEASEEIALRRLDEVALDLQLEDDILIKVDVQGYEDQVIAGGRKTISGAKLLIVETSFQHLYRGQPLFAEIFDLLRSMGFAYHGSVGQLHNPLDGCVLQADSIFMKASK